MQTLNSYMVDSSSKPKKSMLFELDEDLKSAKQKAEILSGENERLR